jgi:hypothetical protein
MGSPLPLAGYTMVKCHGSIPGSTTRSPYQVACLEGDIYQERVFRNSELIDKEMKKRKRRD